MSPRSQGSATNPPATTPAGSSADFSFYEMVTALHQSMGRLEGTVQSLTTASAAQGTELSALGKEVAKGQMVLKMSATIIGLSIPVAAIVVTIILHFWK